MYPFITPGIFISQPFGDFLVTVIPARVLLDTAYSDRLTATPQTDGTYVLSGSQRELLEPRLRNIGVFLDSGAAAFPNSIILAANYREEDGMIEDDEAVKWGIGEVDAKGSTLLTIPKPLKLAPIIDGQHRLFSYNYVHNINRLDMPLVCSIYFDLPKPYQAFLFATINANQRSVSKSQTYELFGYNIEDEPEQKWTPEKLAVFITRKLNSDPDSPFYRHIIVPADNDMSLNKKEILQANDWAVSLSTVVEGILRLLTPNPKKDAYTMAGPVRYEGQDRTVLTPAQKPENYPLRTLYLSKSDDLIYSAIKNYFKAVNKLFWNNASSSSYIFKTVGIQALFDVARPIMASSVANKDIRPDVFESYLGASASIDFSDRAFHASGTGRQLIRTSIQLCLGVRTLDSIRDEEDRNLFRRICSIHE